MIRDRQPAVRAVLIGLAAGLLCTSSTAADPELDAQVDAFVAEVGDLTEIATSRVPPIGGYIRRADRVAEEEFGIRAGDIILSNGGVAETSHLMPFDKTKDREIVFWSAEEGVTKSVTIPADRTLRVTVADHWLPYADYLRSPWADHVWDRHVVAAIGLASRDPELANRAFDAALDAGLDGDGAFGTAMRAQLAYFGRRDDEARALLGQLSPPLDELPHDVFPGLYRAALGLGDVKTMAAALTKRPDFYWRYSAPYPDVARTIVPPQSFAMMEKAVERHVARWGDSAVPPIPVGELEKTSILKRADLRTLFWTYRSRPPQSLVRVPAGYWIKRVSDLDQELHDFDLRWDFQMKLSGINKPGSNYLHFSLREQGSDKTILGFQVEYQSGIERTFFRAIYEDGWAHQFTPDFEVSTEAFTDNQIIGIRSFDGRGEIWLNGLCLARVAIETDKPLKLFAELKGVEIKAGEFKIDALNSR